MSDFIQKYFGDILAEENEKYKAVEEKYRIAEADRKTAEEKYKAAEARRKVVESENVRLRNLLIANGINP